MKTRDLTSLRKTYVELRDALVQNIQKADCEVDVAGDSIDKLQGAALLRVQNQLSKIQLTKLRNLQRAIDLIDAGEYGECEECGAEIGMKRMQAIPGVAICIVCAEEAELQRH